MSLLVVGGTGTLGRQIVRQALREGYEVKCLIRDFTRADFLKQWGATLIYGDLSIPSTLPLSMKGVRVVLDCSTVRTLSPYNMVSVDWRGKLILIELSKLIGLDKFISFSLADNVRISETFPVLNILGSGSQLFYQTSARTSTPLMSLKNKVKKELDKSGIDYTIFQCPGFFQGLISQYALPILEGEVVWLPREFTESAYVDASDFAEVVINSLVTLKYRKKVVSLLGDVFWSPSAIVDVCERLSGKTARVSYLSQYFISFLSKFLRFFESTWNIADRLEFGNTSLCSGPGLFLLLPENYLNFFKTPFPFFFSKVRFLWGQDDINWVGWLFLDKKAPLLRIPLRPESETLWLDTVVGEPLELEIYLRDYFERVLQLLKKFKYQRVLARYEEQSQGSDEISFAVKELYLRRVLPELHVVYSAVRKDFSGRRHDDL
jgi:uncharacterized protein YbjT (DUF2867 family)